LIDDKVWVRAVATDDGGCSSLPEKVWIKIDGQNGSGASADEDEDP
jgi:hypothetical protein